MSDSDFENRGQPNMNVNSANKYMDGTDDAKLSLPNGEKVNRKKFEDLYM